MTSLEPRWDTAFCPARHFSGALCSLPPPHREQAHEGRLIEAGRLVKVIWSELVIRRPK